jgi:hypothetical protein
MSSSWPRRRDRPAPALAWRQRWRPALAAALLLGLGGALVAGIVVIIRNKYGKEVAREHVSDGGSLEIREDTKEGKPEAIAKDGEPDPHAAKWVLSMGGWIGIRQDGQNKEIRVAKDLPAAPFELVTAALGSNEKVDDAGLEHLKALTSLTSLNRASPSNC